MSILTPEPSSVIKKAASAAGGFFNSPMANTVAQLSESRKIQAIKRPA